MTTRAFTDEEVRILDAALHATMVTLVVTPCVKLIESHQGRGYYSQLQTMMPVAFPGMPGMPVPGIPVQPVNRPGQPGA
jgi:hypothetical protein